MIGNCTPIQRIEIIGLHHDRDIFLDFDAPVKILVDENGSGKTTFLNLLVGILQGDLQKVRRYNFQSIEIIFSDTEKVKFEQQDILTQGFKDSDQLITTMQAHFPAYLIDEATSRISGEPLTRAIEDPMVEMIASELGVDPLYLVDTLGDNRQIDYLKQELLTGGQAPLYKSPNDNFKEKSELIKEFFPHRILYFPTYRLVEENLHNLGYQKRDIFSHTEQLIQFGMENVSNRWDRIIQDMRNTSINGFSQVNGHMLEELTEEINPATIRYEKIEDEQALALALSRSGGDVTKKSRQRILELVQSQKIREEKFEPLAYFLSKLITIYESQKDKDDSINNFVKVVNGYMYDKEIAYDASELSLKVVNKSDRTPIRLDKLSSGEKQIVSIFSKLFLDFESEKRFAIFFDEPELSLSMEWQEKLLQDIVDSKRAAFLCAATHSPFIYEGDLLEHTDVLNVRLTGGQNGGH